jgi:type IV pilus assembly protein PilC
MAFKYKVYTADKKIVQGKLDVADEKLAEDTLYTAGYARVLSLEKIPEKVEIENLIPSLFGVKPREVIDASNQLATLIQSGISLLSSLRLLGGQTEKTALKKLFNGLADAIQGGSSLSQALTRYPRVFNNTYCQIIRASEQAGTLDMGLLQVGVYLEKRHHTQQKMTRALLYPSFVVILAVFVSILLVTVALPPLTQLFESFKAQLPWTTQALVAVSHFLQDSKVPIILGILSFIFVIYGLSRLPSVQLAYDRFILRLPIFGSIAIERSMALFCQTTSMLLKAGMRLPPILEIVMQTNRNQVLKRSFVTVRERLIQGEGISQPMSQNKLFPPLLVEMIIVGEKTGTMDNTLARLADFYEAKVDRRIDMLISMIEPALTLLVGALVIFIALSMVMPMYSILKQM